MAAVKQKSVQKSSTVEPVMKKPRKERAASVDSEPSDAEPAATLTKDKVNV